MSAAQNEKTSFKLYPDKAQKESRTDLENSRTVYLWRLRGDRSQLLHGAKGYTKILK